MESHQQLRRRSESAANNRNRIRFPKKRSRVLREHRPSRAYPAAAEPLVFFPFGGRGTGSTPDAATHVLTSAPCPARSLPPDPRGGSCLSTPWLEKDCSSGRRRSPRAFRVSQRRQLQAFFRLNVVRSEQYGEKFPINTCATVTWCSDCIYPGWRARR